MNLEILATSLLKKEEISIPQLSDLYFENGQFGNITFLPLMSFLANVFYTQWLKPIPESFSSFVISIILLHSQV